MSFIQQFFTSRDNNANAETFVGQEGRLWWDPVSNQIYSSDGNTPGGIPLAGGGGGGSPGGSNSQVQFNSSGTFGGSSLLTFDRVSGALTAVSFAGDGSALANITGANVVGVVTEAVYASSAVTSINAETVTANNQPNINSVGILTSLSVTGNIQTNSEVLVGNSRIYDSNNYTTISGVEGSELYWTDEVSGGATVGVEGIAAYMTTGSIDGTSNISVYPGNVNVRSSGNINLLSNGNTWVFEPTGNLQLPNQANISIDPEWGYTNLNSAPNSVISLQGISTGGGSIATVTADGEFGIVTVRVEGANEEFTSEWAFLPDGSIAFPYQKLLGNASQFSGDFRVISTANIAILANLNPTTADSGAAGYSVEIGAGPGANSTVSGNASGHGGNVYIAAGQGGDTVDYANAGPGGSVFIQGGATWNYTAPGGNVELEGGQGIFSTTAGNVRLRAGGAGNVEFSSNTGVFSAAGNIMTGNYFIGDGSLLTSVTANNVGNLSVTGTDVSITSGATETLINISPSGEGWTYLQLPTNATANINNTRLHNDAGNVEIGTGNFSTGSSSYEWVFGTDGTLHLPENTAYISSGTNALSLHANDIEVIYISDISGGISLETNANVTILSNVAGETNYAWTFNNDGTMSFPSNIINSGSNPVTLWSTNTSSLLWRSPTGGGPGVPFQTTVNANDGNATIDLTTGTAGVGSVYTWTFNTSNVVFPDNTVQTTAYPGTDTSLSLTSNITGGNLLTGGLVSATGNITGGNILGGANVNATTHTGATASLSGNVTGGNILTGGLISATGNVTGGNLTTGARVVATGNVTGGNLTTAGSVYVGTRGQLYDDGNFHIHCNGSGDALWINTNAAQLNLLAEPAGGGSLGTGVGIGTSSLTGFVTIQGVKSWTTASSYGYLINSATPTGQYNGGSQTITDVSLYANGRLMGIEIDALSDERAKDIQGNISLDDALTFVRSVDGILYTWRPEVVDGKDTGLKSGFSAQKVHKAGFGHMISMMPNDKLAETTDEDGWTSPDKTQLSMNYSQAIPYHQVVIKHLLDRIEQLEATVAKLAK